MPRIYITYRLNDTSEDEVQYIVEQMSAAFGADNIHVTDAAAQVDVLKLYDLVQSYDALLLVIGKNWLGMTNEQGERLIEDPFDYIYTEIFAALEKPDMWISTLLVDEAKMPKPEELPEPIRDVVRRDVITLLNRQQLTQQIEELRRRLGVIDSYVPEAEIEQPPAPIIRPAQPSVEPVAENPNTYLWVFILLGLGITAFCGFILLTQPDPSERYAPQLTRLAGLTEQALIAETSQAERYQAATERAMCAAPEPTNTRFADTQLTSPITDDVYTSDDFRWNDSIRRLNLTSLPEIHGDAQASPQIAFDPSDDSRFAVAWRNDVELYNLRNWRREVVQRWEFGNPTIKEIRFSPDGEYLIAATYSSHIAILSDDGSIQILPVSIARFYNIAFFPDADTVMAVTRNAQLQFRAMPTLESVDNPGFAIPEGDVQSFDVNRRDDAILVGYESGEFYLNNSRLEGVDNDTTPTSDVDFSPNGFYAGGIIGSHIYLWETETQRRILTIDLAPHQPKHLEIINRNTLLVNTRDDVFMLYLDSREVDPVYGLPLEYIPHTLYEATFNPQNTWLAISNAQGVVTLMRLCS